MNTSLALRVACCLSLAALPAAAENWPQWRGPALDGSTTETNLPQSWSKTENILWTAKLPGPSHATPIVWDDSVFINSLDSDGNLLLLCLDRRTGKLRWQQQIGVGSAHEGLNNLASPSPVTDGKMVWTLFGSGDLAAFDFSGKKIWERHLTGEYGRFQLNYLYGSSPLLYNGRLYVEVLRRGPAESFLLSIDPLSGSNIWRHIRATDAVQESQEAYTTPMPCECPGHTEIVIAGGDYITGEDAATGEEIWRAAGLRNFRARGTSRLVPSPVIADGLVFACGAKHNPFLAFHQGGQGDITSNGLAWKSESFTTDCVTPLFYQGKLFMLDGDRQTMYCVEPKTGKVEWRHSLGIHDVFRASPTGADGKIYCLSEYATAVVLSAADGNVLSTIDMSQGDEGDQGRSHSTIAAAQGCLFLRVPGTLYCISKNKL